MALLISSSLSHTAHHPSLRNNLGPNCDNSSWGLSSSRKSKRRCGLSLRSRAERIRSELVPESLNDWEIPRREWFDRDFIFGASTSAYQVEGAWNEDGKGPSTWDHFCHNHPDKIVDGSNGDIAVNSYHMYAEDVRMLKEMGMDAYRLSISWSRILPKGTLEGGINYKGILYYKNLINLLIENGIQPYVTIFHWDTPLALHKQYGGFLSSRIVKDYTNYAKVCFEHFGDKVKHWFTFNEPHIFCNNAYGTGRHAPGRCSPGLTCAVPRGDSLTEPYIAGHHLLLAHSEAADLYNKNYKGQDGFIGMALDAQFYEPYGTSFLDKQAQQRSLDFDLGWFMEPVSRGDYPFSMRSLVGNRLPYFKDEEQAKLVSSRNMMGINYYTSNFSEHIDMSPSFSPVLNTDDQHARLSLIGPDGNPIGPNTGMDRIKVYPEGLRELLLLIKDKYGNPPIYITENGVGDMDNGNLPMRDALNDTIRLDYLQRHIAALKESIDLGSNVRGHFTWSLLDNFEWSNGYGPRFGLIYVDRNDGFRRHMKRSARWFREFNRGVRRPTVEEKEDVVLEPALVSAS